MIGLNYVCFYAKEELFAILGTHQWTSPLVCPQSSENYHRMIFNFSRFHWFYVT